MFLPIISVFLSSCDFLRKFAKSTWLQNLWFSCNLDFQPVAILGLAFNHREGCRSGYMISHIKGEGIGLSSRQVFLSNQGLEGGHIASAWHLNQFEIPNAQDRLGFLTNPEVDPIRTALEVRQATRWSWTSYKRVTRHDSPFLYIRDRRWRKWSPRKGDSDGTPGESSGNCSPYPFSRTIL